jgi:hypothetical protein
MTQMIGESLQQFVATGRHLTHQELVWLQRIFLLRQAANAL